MTSNQEKFYFPYFIKNKIIIEEAYLTVNKNILFSSREDAEEAISKIIPIAQEKAKKIKEKLKKDMKDENFSLNYSLVGEAALLKDFYPSISFQMNNFYFEFEYSDINLILRD